MSSAADFNRTQAFLAAALTELGLKNVAWAGEAGQRYFGNTGKYSRRLARLSVFAQSEVDLVQLASGWKRVQMQLENATPELTPRNWHEELLNELIIVVEALPPELLKILRQLLKQQLRFVLILIDANRRYVSSPRQSIRRGIGWPGPYAQSLGLTFPDPLEISTTDKLKRSLAELSTLDGIKVLHLLGTPQETDFLPNYRSSSERRALPPMEAIVEPDVPMTPGPKDYSMASLALERITQDLMVLGEVSCLWTLEPRPCPLQALRTRFQYCTLEGAMLQAIGMVNSGTHPVVALAASSLPLILPDLLYFAPFPITFLILDGGLANGNEGNHSSASRIRDLALLRQIPNMTIAVPADEEEARGMLRALLCQATPGVLRLTQAPAVSAPVNADKPILTPGLGRQLRSGEDISLVGIGSPVYYAMLAAEAINSWGFQAGVYDLRYLYPLDRELLQRASRSGKIITIEEHAPTGGLSTAVLEVLATFNEPEESRQLICRSIGIDLQLEANDLEAHSIYPEGIVQQAKILLNLPQIPRPGADLGPLA